MGGVEKGSPTHHKGPRPWHRTASKKHWPPLLLWETEMKHITWRRGVCVCVCILIHMVTLPKEEKPRRVPWLHRWPLQNGSSALALLVSPKLPSHSAATGCSNWKAFPWRKPEKYGDGVLSKSGWCPKPFNPGPKYPGPIPDPGGSSGDLASKGTTLLPELCSDPLLQVTNL